MSIFTSQRRSVSTHSLVLPSPWMKFSAAALTTLLFFGILTIWIPYRWPVVYPAYALFDPGLFANHAPNDWAEVE